MKVLHNREDGLLTCTCRHYLRYGLLCRHCFWILNFIWNINEIPERYINRRWRRDIIPPDLRSRRNKYGNANNGVQKYVHEINTVVEDCIDNLVPDEKMLQEFLDKVKALKIDVEKNVQKTPKKKKEDTMADLTGTRRPGEILVSNPPVGSYKGCAKNTRIMGGKELGIKESQKRKVMCRNCGGTNHNARTCGKEKVTKKQCTSTNSAKQNNSNEASVINP